MTKYFKRGIREFYSVSETRVIRIINKHAMSEVTISWVTGTDTGTKYFQEEDALEGTEISREEFKEQFEVASRLIVLEP